MGKPAMAIDMHAHWSPRGLLRENAAGRTWYGWRVVRDDKGRENVAFGDRVLTFAVSKSVLTDPIARAADRKQHEDIDMEALIPTGVFWNYHLDEIAARRFTREVNEEIAEVQKAYPDRFRGMAVLPMQHPRLALQELDYAVNHLGLTTIVIASNVCGANLDEPTVLPLLEAAAGMDVSIVVHPVYWGKPGEERFPRYHFENSFGAPLESSLAAMSVVYSGLLDRYPDLRIMFTQGGGWIHFGVGRFNLRYQQRAEARPMAHPPVDYLSRMYYDCLVHDEDSLELLKKRATADRIMIGTDHPASGNIVGGAVPWVERSPLFTADEKERVLWRNAATFLGLDADTLRLDRRSAA
ncbi:MAG: amidohydrolase family protein [Burkholderiales bacterium]